MYLDDEDDFDLVGGAPAPTDEDEDTSEEVETEEETEATEETEEVTEASETEETEEKPKNNRAIALSNERARRKAAERELKELKSKLEADKTAKDNEDKIAKEREAYKAKMLEGDLVDEDVAEKLLDVFGDDIIKTKIENQERAEAASFDKAISELKKDERFMDADKYTDQIKSFMKMGLTPEQAYGASLSGAGLLQLKKDMETEIEQKLLNTDEKLSKVDVGHTEAKTEVKGGRYTKREQEIARETGLPVAEVHKRSQIVDIDKMLDL